MPIPRPRKIFISYSHAQGAWVWDRLVPVLRAGRAEVLIDQERFAAGKALFRQMDTAQDVADVDVLVLSPEYLKSAACIHEMERAIARDPRFERGLVLPVVRIQVELPEPLLRLNPLYVDLVDDARNGAHAWDLLLQACGSDLGMDAPTWLTARDDVRRFLERGQSVNLVVDGAVSWRELLADLRRGELADLTRIDLESPATASRRGLIAEILTQLGMPAPVPAEPEDLVTLHNVLANGPRRCLILTHFDLVAFRPSYGIEFFSSLRFLVTEGGKLTLLVQSRRPLANLLPAGHFVAESGLQSALQTVELRARR